MVPGGGPSCTARAQQLDDQEGPPPFAGPGRQVPAPRPAGLEGWWPGASDPHLACAAKHSPARKLPAHVLSVRERGDSCRPRPRTTVPPG